jgi:hypothetical protein
MSARSSRRAGSGVNRGSLTPQISVILSGTTSSQFPADPKTKDIVIDATSSPVVIYVWDGSVWQV